MSFINETEIDTSKSESISTRPRLITPKFHKQDLDVYCFLTILQFCVRIGNTQIIHTLAVFQISLQSQNLNVLYYKVRVEVDETRLDL